MFLESYLIVFGFSSVKSSIFDGWEESSPPSMIMSGFRSFIIDVFVITGFPDMFALVVINGFPVFCIIFVIGCSGILMPSLVVSEQCFKNVLFFFSRMSVILPGSSLRNSSCLIVKLSLIHVIDGAITESGCFVCFMCRNLSTALLFVASHPIPYTVSVG